MHNHASSNFHLSHVQDRWASLYSSCPRQNHVHCIAAGSCGFHPKVTEFFFMVPVQWKCCHSGKNYVKSCETSRIKTSFSNHRPQCPMCWFNVSDTEILNKVRTPFSCSFTPDFYCWAWFHVAWDSPSITLSQLSWFCHLPISGTCSLLTEGEEWRKWENLDGLQTLLSNSQNTGVLSTLF